MRRGVLLLVAGVTAGVVLFAPTLPASSEIATPARVVQLTSTTVASDPAAAPTTVAAADSTVRDDPAATRLRRITYALVGLGALILVLNLVFWKVTRPALLLPARGRPDEVPASAPPIAAGAAPVAAPTKISASAFLATPPGAAVPGAGAPALALPLAGAVATVAVVAPDVTATMPVPGDEPPPEGSPVIDAPAPLDDIPLGAPKPLVGTDSAWIIEPESGSGLIPDTPTAVDFPEAGAPVAPVADPIEVSSTEAGPATSGDLPASPPPEESAPTYSTATQALISALSAIPDKEPTVVRFDDPPVERVSPRTAPVVEPAAPATPAVKAAAPKGAPGFDRIAKEATATNAAVPERQVDDMALMASALSSLPLRQPPEVDDPDLPPVGEFYDQDLDPGDPPGRD